MFSLASFVMTSSPTDAHGILCVSNFLRRELHPRLARMSSVGQAALFQTRPTRDGNLEIPDSLQESPSECSLEKSCFPWLEGCYSLLH